VVPANVEVDHPKEVEGVGDIAPPVSRRVLGVPALSEKIEALAAFDGVVFFLIYKATAVTTQFEDTWILLQPYGCAYPVTAKSA
jgi:hypothetical protein